MDSDFQQQQFHDYFQNIQDQFQQQKQQTNSGLIRYRSAPSSYFSTFLDTPPNTPTTTTINNSTSDLQQPPRPLSPETENILATFLSSIDGGNTANDSMTQQKPCADILEESEFTRAVKQEADPIQLMYQRPPSEPGWANQNNSAPSNSAVQGPFRAPYSTGFDSTGHGSNHLVRQRSSPAGLFNDLSIDKSNGSCLQISQQQACFGAGLVTQSSNFGGQNTGIDGLDDRIFGNSVNRSGGGGGSSSSNVTGAAASYLTGYPVSSWDECGGLEGIGRDDETKMFSESENQKGDAGNRPPLPLSHHLSLPKNALEKLFRFQDSTPMKIRARRGCATHPRSIAERVRRTKISERMRKLQDLVPNMDKQTNTADMLDLAVDYIKDLQKQVKELGNNRAKCTCPS